MGNKKSKSKNEKCGHVSSGMKEMRKELQVVLLGGGGMGLYVPFVALYKILTNLFQFKGKSAIVIRFVNGQFVQNYDPTIEDS